MEHQAKFSTSPEGVSETAQKKKTNNNEKVLFVVCVLCVIRLLPPQKKSKTSKMQEVRYEHVSVRYPARNFHC